MILMICHPQEIEKSSPLKYPKKNICPYGCPKFMDVQLPLFMMNVTYKEKHQCVSWWDILMTNYDHHELSFHFDSNNPLGYYHNHSSLLLFLMILSYPNDDPPFFPSARCGWAPPMTGSGMMIDPPRRQVTWIMTGWGVLPSDDWSILPCFFFFTMENDGFYRGFYLEKYGALNDHETWWDFHDEKSFWI